MKTVLLALIIALTASPALCGNIFIPGNSVRHAASQVTPVMIQTLNISLAVLPHGIKRGEFAVVGILEGNIVGVVVVVKIARPLTICFGVHLYLTAVIRQSKIYRLMCRYVYFYFRLVVM